MSDDRLNPEREQELRTELADDDPRYPDSLVMGKEGETLVILTEDLRALLGEITYLREQVQAETAHASELTRRLVAQGGAAPVEKPWPNVAGPALDTEIGHVELPPGMAR